MITLKRDSLRKKDIARWIATGILTIRLLVFLWAAYPGYVFHDYFLSKTMSNRYTSTEVLSGQMMATQYFVPQLPRLYSIQIAAEFDEEKTNGETVTFSLCEESGNVLFTRDIALSEMEAATYYDIVVNQKLEPGRTYFWNITSPRDSAPGWKVMYTEYVEDQAPENILFHIDDNPYGNEAAQTISQYNYYQHHDKSLIIAGFWMMGILAYIICLEIIRRVA